MGTTVKALKLLDLFSTSRPEIGLSDFARLAGRDKATTHRHLAELCALGFVEQAHQSKLYRLGPAVLRLANIREQTFPMKTAAAGYLAELVEAVCETAHTTALQGMLLSPVHTHDSLHHTTRVYIDSAEMLPLYATASGCVIMAFGADDLMDMVLAGPLKAQTPATRFQPDEIREKVATAKSTGFGRSKGEFEAGVSSIAAPLFNENDECTGAVAVVCPSGRMTGALDRKITENLAITARAISKSMGGNIPASLLEIWQRQGLG